MNEAVLFLSERYSSKNMYEAKTDREIDLIHNKIIQAYLIFIFSQLSSLFLHKKSYMV